jgi:hypothetical protein
MYIQMYCVIFKNKNPYSVQCQYIWLNILYSENRIGSVMINILVSSVVDRGFEPQSGWSHMWSKNIKLVFVASPLSM